MEERENTWMIWKLSSEARNVAWNLYKTDRCVREQKPEETPVGRRLWEKSATPRPRDSGRLTDVIAVRKENTLNKFQPK